jgi:hypothetical protein
MGLFDLSPAPVYPGLCLGFVLGELKVERTGIPGGDGSRVGGFRFIEWKEISLW